MSLKYFGIGYFSTECYTTIIAPVLFVGIARLSDKNCAPAFRQERISWTSIIFINDMPYRYGCRRMQLAGHLASCIEVWPMVMQLRLLRRSFTAR